MKEVPEGYVRRTVGRAEVWSWSPTADQVVALLEDHETLHDWASGVDAARALQGRGTVWDVPAPGPGPEGRSRWAVRHFRRGGMMEPLLEDRYVAGMDAPRPLAELYASVGVRARGIPTPAVVAAAMYPAGVFYRGDLVTELIPDGTDLRGLLFAEADPWAEPALEETGRLVRRMELAGVYHPDLNAANLLVTARTTGASEAPGDASGLTVHLLDLDRCQTREGGTPAPRGPMRERLERSLRKLGAASDRPLSDGEWAALRRGFEADPR